MQRFLKGNALALILFAVLAVRMILSRDFFSDPLAYLIDTLYLLPGIIIGITVHEWAHAFAAYKLGDITPKAQHRVTLNPIRHIDPIGFIALLFIGFGWGKPVEVNPYAFRKPRRDNLITDVAGIFTNFVFAFVFMGLCRALYEIVEMTGYTQAADIVMNVLMYCVQINLVLMIFNLLPVPPLDGFGIITEIFGLRGRPIYYQIYNAGFPILIVLIMLNVPAKIISPVIGFLFNFISGVFF